MAEKSVSTDSLAAPKTQTHTGKKLRVAMIGCGGIAQVHLDALKQFPDLEIVAGVDIDEARLQTMRDKWNVAATFTDWKQMLKETRPDAVNICTPNGLHMQ